MSCCIGRVCRERAPRTFGIAFEWRMSIGKGATKTLFRYLVQQRLKPRGKEVVLFGENGMNEEGLIQIVGHIEQYSGFVSESHPVTLVKCKDSRYWLPTDSDSAFIVITFDEAQRRREEARSVAKLYSTPGGATEQDGRTRLRRLTAIRFQNRYSTTFEVYFRRREADEWSTLVAPQVGLIAVTEKVLGHELLSSLLHLCLPFFFLSRFSSFLRFLPLPRPLGSRLGR